MSVLTGYLHPNYAQSLAEFGTPRFLPECKGWILERAIYGSSHRDAMGCYPLFACQDWSRLHADVQELGNSLVSLALVTDPFGEYDVAYLHQCFQNRVLPFKKHFVIDLSKASNQLVSKHHRYYARKALEKVSIQECQDPRQFTNEWMDLYSVLISRHDLKGIKAFSKQAFYQQLCVPGMVAFQAIYQDMTIGAHLWYVQGDVAFSHLEASSSVGYEMMVSYALYWFAINYFADKVHWLDLGAGAGIDTTDTDGLSRFKQGWSTESRLVYFCGRIFDHAKYSELVGMNHISMRDYFPAYRTGEFK